MHEEKEIETKKSDNSEIPNCLNELADYARRQVEELLPVIKKYNDYSEEQIEELRTHLMAMFLEGAGWQKEQMMKGAVDGMVRKDGTIGYFEMTDEQQFKSLLEKFQDGDKVRIIVCKKEAKK